MSQSLPGTDYLNRMRDFYEDQFQYWKDVTAQLNSTAEKVRGERDYSVKDWLRDGLKLWGMSFSAFESLINAPLDRAGDQSTPVLSFMVRLGSGSADPKSVRIRPIDGATLVASNLVSTGGAVIQPSSVVVSMLQQGVLEVSLQNLSHTPQGQYFGAISNSDRSLAIVHVLVEPA